MDDLDQTKKQLVTELAQLRQRMAELEGIETEYKQTKEALQASETQYRRLFEAAQDGILILDAATGKITAVNPFLTDLLGYSEKEIVGKKLWEIGPFKDIEISKVAFEELQSEEYIRYEDLPLETRNGRAISVEFVSNVYLADQKKVIQCNIRDITERKRAEEALRESEARYRRTLDNMLGSCQIIDFDWRYVYVNDAAARQGKRKPAELLHHTMMEMYPGIENTELFTVLRRCMEERSLEHMENKFIYPDGTVGWFELSIQPVPEGIFILSLDITQRKQIEEALKKSEASLAKAQQIAQLGSWELDLADLDNIDRNNLRWSDEVYRIFGYNPGEIEPSNELFFRAVPADEIPLIQQGVAQTIAENKIFSMDHHIILPDGTERIVHEYADVICDELTGRPLQLIGVIQDITERKELEAKNQKLSEQFYQAQKLDSIGQLAGGIAHDFNNMLVPIVGYAELAQMLVAPDSKPYAYLSEIKKAAGYSADLTRQILAFSRQQELELKPLDLNLVISEFEPMLRRLIGEDIDLQTRLTADLPALKADNGQLEQVLLNLVVNARDAMPDGGTLIIETAPVTLDEAYVAQHLEAQLGPHVLLAVSDTGQGMDAATQQRIFEPFFTTKPTSQGTGLGLATVFGIVKQHGGNIWVYSEPGQGTTFKIYLPLADTPVSTAEPQLPEAGSLDGTETVLLVEDEASVRELVSETLRTYGYRVLEASEPEKGLALAAAHEGPIHLLLSDIIMPQMNGLKLYKQLLLSRSGLKVLYISGYTDNIIAYHDVLDEETAFLQKPFTLHSLLQKVRAVLG